MSVVEFAGSNRGYRSLEAASQRGAAAATITVSPLAWTLCTVIFASATPATANAATVGAANNLSAIIHSTPLSPPAPTTYAIDTDAVPIQHVHSLVFIDRANIPNSTASSVGTGPIGSRETYIRLTNIARTHANTIVPLELGLVTEPTTPIASASLHSREGSSAAGRLLRLGIKHWWKSRSDTPLHRLSDKAPPVVRNGGLKGRVKYNWNYSLKLSDDDLKLRLKKEF